MYSRTVSVWLFTSAALVVAMVVLGGLTRLTHSGLSITEWKPVTGFLPPFTPQDWEGLFAAYRRSPEFIHLYPQMDLAEFKDIFWLEFIHRFVGRCVGLVWLLPLLYFLVSKKISGSVALKMLGIFGLGALQGGIGWFMVRSGLVKEPHVSHYWLTAHLLAACVILSLMLMTAFYTLGLEKEKVSMGIKYVARTLLVLVFLQIGFGALVAGLHAGLIFNTFPDMNGQMIPDELFFLHPWYRNLSDNPATVQFLHRLGACGIILAGGVLAVMMWWRRFSHPRLWWSVVALVVAIAFQCFLGVITLLLQVPVAGASLHQLMAMILFAIALFINYIL